MSKYQIRNLDVGDLPFAQQVRRIALWNQTDADWHRLIDYGGAGCFLIQCNGRPAGTATTTIFAGQMAWIGMILVHPSFRRQGLATALVNHCLEYLLNQVRVPCVKLDATADGQQLYSKLGFRSQYELNRWEGRMPVQPLAPGIDSSSPFGEIGTGGSRCWQALDRSVFGVDRSRFLQRLAVDSRRTLQLDDQGFGMLRDGAFASYLGPVVATHEPIGKRLVMRLLGHDQRSPMITDHRPPAEHSGGAVYWDIPSGNRPAEQLAEQLGFVRQRPLIRMWTGPGNVCDDPGRQWGIAGPETG